MKVFGLMTDSDRTKPYPEDGDGMAFMIVSIVALVAAYTYFGVTWPAYLAGFIILFMLTGGCLKFRLLGGDMYEPSQERIPFPETPPGTKLDWFNSVPVSVVRKYFPIPCCPFISIGWQEYGFYIGAKIFGFDLEAYKRYPEIDPAKDVYVGSQAFCWSVRPTTSRHD
jgi:hypothetical protein